MTAETSATWRMALSVSVAAGAYGVSLGALTVVVGLDVWQVMVLSLLVYTGGLQSVFVEVLVGGGSSVIGAVMLVGLRNAVHMMQVNSWFHPLWAQRILMAHFTIDEPTTVATIQPDQRLRKLGFWAIGAGVLALWNAMTLVGALLGNLLGDLRAWGLGGAILAAFYGLLWLRLVTRDVVVMAIVAVVVTVVLVPVFPVGLPILATIVVGGGITLLQRRCIARRDQSSRDEGAR